MYVDTCAYTPTYTYTYLGACIHMHTDMHTKKKGEFFIGTKWLWIPR